MTGWIATFYSYKGGVGRSFLLANVATLLAKWGYRTLCVDFDIEAPGLDEYFRPWLGPSPRPGLIELVERFSSGPSANWREHINEVPLPGTNKKLDLMTSGTQDESFIERVQQVNWRKLYDEHQFGTVLEAVRDELKETYDFVLIDSRTGITDIGGICTVHLPDVLVPVFTANHQSLDGIVKIVQQARAQRDKLPLNRAALLVLPVPSRFDARGQDEMAKQWLREFAEKLELFYDTWLDADLSPRQLLDIARIPYFSIWTFGERLAVLEERANDPERISYHFATIAALLARRLTGSEQLAKNRDSYVNAAVKEQHAGSADDGGYKYDCYLSYGSKGGSTALEVADLLRSVGMRVFLDVQDAVGPDARAKLDDALSNSRHFILIEEGPVSTWQLVESQTFASLRQAELAELPSSQQPQRNLVFLRLGAANGPSLGALTGLAVVVRVQNGDLRAALAEAFPSIATALRSGNSVEVDEALMALAREYVAVSLPDREARVAERDRLAILLCTHVLKHGTSRDALVSGQNDGLTVALAEAATRRPEPDDLKRLIEAGDSLRLLHAAFRLLLAVLAITETTSVSSHDRTSLLHLLDKLQALAESRKDPPLLNLVDTVRRRMANVA